MSEMYGSVIKCHGCGAPLDLNQGLICECSTCGIKNIIPKMITADRQQEFENAKEYIRTMDFDRAEAIIKSLLLDFGNDAELYWSLVLCKYGIVFNEDYTTHKSVPTILRMNANYILSDSDYLNALKFSSDDEKSVYMEYAAQIGNIQRQYNEIISNERPFDIFISYKESEVDQNGNNVRTNDSVKAQGIYEKLTELGYKVFFSRITLEETVGVAYEPYIYAAMNSSKVMLLVSSSVKNINSAWVKNEWSRYLKLMEQDKSKRIATAVFNMNFEELPERLSIYQAINLSLIGNEDELIRRIKKMLPLKAATESSAQYIQGESVENYAIRAQLEIEAGKFEVARDYIEKGLNIDANNGLLYLYQLMVDCKARNTRELLNYSETYSTFESYHRFMRFTNDQEMKNALMQRDNVNVQRKNECIRQQEEARRIKQAEQQLQWEIEQKKQKRKKFVLSIVSCPAIWYFIIFFVGISICNKVGGNVVVTESGRTRIKIIDWIAFGASIFLTILSAIRKKDNDGIRGFGRFIFYSAICYMGYCITYDVINGYSLNEAFYNAIIAFWNNL